MVKFHKTLSERSVYFRYFGSPSLKTRVAHERLSRICAADYDRELVLVAEIQAPARVVRARVVGAQIANAGAVEPLGGAPQSVLQIIGIGRINRLPGTDEAEVAVLVADDYQKRGVGEELLRRAIWVAREEGIHALSAEMMADNRAMQVIAKRLGFRVKMQRDFASLRARLEL